MDLDLNNRRWSKTFIAYENPELINMLWGLAINPAGNKVVIHSTKHISGKTIDDGNTIDNIWVVNTEDGSYVNKPLRVGFPGFYKIVSSAQTYFGENDIVYTAYQNAKDVTNDNNMRLIQYDAAQGIVNWHMAQTEVEGKSSSLQVLAGATDADYQIYLGGVVQVSSTNECPVICHLDYQGLKKSC